jgi:hypothetical protein
LAFTALGCTLNLIGFGTSGSRPRDEFGFLAVESCSLGLGLVVAWQCGLHVNGASVLVLRSSRFDGAA